MMEARGRQRELDNRYGGLVMQETEVSRAQLPADDRAQAARNKARAAADITAQRADAVQDAEAKAAAARAALAKDSRVRKAREEIEKTKNGLRPAVGASGLGDPAALGLQLRDPKFRGDENSKLWQIGKELDQVQTQLDAVFRIGNTGPSQQDLEDKKTKLLKQIDEVRAEAYQAAQRLQKLQEEDLESAEFVAREKLNQDDVRALEQIDRLHRDLQSARDDQARAEKAAQEAQAEAARLTAKSRELHDASDKFRQEDEALREEIRRLEAADPDPIDQVDAAADKLREARKAQTAAQTALDRMDKSLGELRREKQGLGPEIERRLQAARNVLNDAMGADRDNRVTDCAAHVKQARADIEVAASLYQENSACVDASLQSQIQYALTLPTKVSCGGHTISPLPADGLTTVPSVVNRPKDEARQILTAAGFKASMIEYRLPPTRNMAFLVSGQDPAPGARAVAGSQVSVSYYGPYTPEPAAPETVSPPPDPTPPPAPPSAAPPAATPPAASSSGAPPGGAFTAAGGARTVSSQPPPGDASAPPIPVGIPSEEELLRQIAAQQMSRRQQADQAKRPPGVPNIWQRNAQAHLASCELHAALRAADILASEEPANAWLGTAYGDIAREVRMQEFVEGLLTQAQAAVNSGNIELGIQLAQQAQTYNSRCVSQKVSGLGPAIAAAQAARAQANREATRQAMGGLAGALSGALGTLAAARVGGPLPRLPEGVPAPGSGGSDMAAAAAAQLAGSLGGGVPAGGAGAPASGAAGAGPSLPANCNACVINDVAASGHRVYYVIGQQQTFPVNQSGCTSANISAYYLFGGDPTDANGRPTTVMPEGENAARVLPGASKICGPCGSFQEASALIRRYCPNPQSVSSDLLRRLGAPQIR